MKHANDNGLTLTEWLRAAGYPFDGSWPVVCRAARPYLMMARLAWASNEDPTDYKADGTFKVVSK